MGWMNAESIRDAIEMLLLRARSKNQLVDIPADDSSSDLEAERGQRVSR
jgi:hypothetical protein